MDIGQFSLHAAVEDRHWWFVARREIIFEILRRYVPRNHHKLVLEIGCGTGGNLRYLQGHYRVTGVDISPEAVSFARERLGCPVLEGDFREIYPETFADVDVVLLADVLEHIEDDRGFLSDILSRIRPGGIILLTVPAHDFLWSKHDVVLGHVRRYSRKQLMAVCEGLPVEIEYGTFFNSLLFPLIALYRYLPEGKARVSNLSLPSSLLNRLLLSLFRIEKFLLKIGPLPLGVSFLTVLKKKYDDPP